MNVVPFTSTPQSLAFLNSVNDFNAVQNVLNALSVCIPNLHKWNFVIDLILFLVLLFHQTLYFSHPSLLLSVLISLI